VKSNDTAVGNLILGRADWCSHVAFSHEWNHRCYNTL